MPFISIRFCKINKEKKHIKKKAFLDSFLNREKTPTITKSVFYSYQQYYFKTINKKGGTDRTVFSTFA